MRVVLSGSLPGGEIWESGFWLYGDLPTDQASANTQASLVYGALTSDDESGAMTQWFANYVSATVTFDKVTVYVYTDGNAATYIGTYVPSTPLTGTGSAELPNQCAIVVTLLTGRAGRAYRGRMYLPLNSSSYMGSDGQLGNGNMVINAQHWARFFGDWAASDAGQPVVVSQVHTAHNAITAVRIDSRVDIQRRRANRQAVTSSTTQALTTS